jgi:diguanylate cyclase (GGDEF)-like protein
VGLRKRKGNMSKRTKLTHSHLTRQNGARSREGLPTAARRSPELSPADLAVVEGDNLLHEVQGLASRLEEARETISRLEEVIVSLQERCITDPLTGAYNRRACEERLAEDVARASRGGGTLTLAVLDVDNLKEVNDRWGHQAGDAYLRHLATALERNIREGDWIARWGGDEFVVALWDAMGQTEKTIVQRVGEDLQRNLVRLGRGEEARVSFSAGVCRHQGGGEGAAELFSRADAALLEAKKGGRGTIVEAS